MQNQQPNLSFWKLHHFEKCIAQTLYGIQIAFAHCFRPLETIHTRTYTIWMPSVGTTLITDYQKTWRTCLSVDGPLKLRALVCCM